MRRFTAIATGLLVTSITAQAAQLATVGGCPNMTLPFVSKMVVDRFTFVGDNCEQDLSTKLYSILEKEGVSATMAVSVVTREGSTDLRTLADGMRVAAQMGKAPVVMVPMGGLAYINELMCEVMEDYPDVAFVTAMGNQGVLQDGTHEPKCASPNILRVAALAKNGRRLLAPTDFGATARIAAPGYKLKTLGENGARRTLSGNTAATAEVAGRLAVFAEKNTGLRGAELIRAFLETETIQVPALNGMIENSRVLKRER